MLWVCRMTSLSVKNVGQVINGKRRLESSWKAAGTFHGQVILANIINWLKWGSKKE